MNTKAPIQDHIHCLQAHPSAMILNPPIDDLGSRPMASMMLIYIETITVPSDEEVVTNHYRMGRHRENIKFIV